MAKALYGHLTTGDPMLALENARLRARVADLLAEVERLNLELAAVAPATDDMPATELFGDSADRRPALA